MVGSILGTFLTGFVLIDLVGTKAVILLLGTTLALSATVLGSVWHAAWTGLPLGLCVIAFLPVNYFQEQGKSGESARTKPTRSSKRTASPTSTRATTTTSR